MPYNYFSLNTLFLAFFLTMSSVAVAQCPGNLITNPDFETDLVGWGRFAGNGGSPIVTQVTGGVGGSNAAQVGPLPDGFFNFTWDRPANVGENYTLSAAARRTVTDGDISVRLEFINNSFQTLGSDQLTISSATFQTFNLSGTVPAGATQVRASVVGSNGAAAVVDDFCLLLVGGPVFNCPGNLVTNGSLDDDTGGWFDFTPGGNSVTHNTTDPLSGAGAGTKADGEVAAFKITDNIVVGNIIKVSGYIRGSNGSNFGINFQKADGSAVQDNPFDGTGGTSNSVSDYEQVFSADETVREGTEEIIIFAQGAGVLSFDNVCVQDLGPDNSFVFPIALSTFTGQAMAKSNKLEWTTATEENTAMFYLERSADGRTDWTTVTELSATGNSQVDQYYAAEDDRPLRNAYYRLRSTDFDGSFQLSDVINVTRDQGLTVAAFPNPFGNTISVATDLEKASDYVLIDALGRQLRVGRIAAGAQRTEIHAADLPAGRYLLRVGKETISLVK